MAGSSRFAVAVHSAGMIAFGDRMTVTSETIARSIGTNPVVVRRVCGMMAKAGLLEMRKGQNGGALLTRTADKISLGQIYRAVESDSIFSIPSCGKREDCMFSKIVAGVLRRFFGKAEDAMLARLDRMKLSDVIESVMAEKHKTDCTHEHIAPTNTRRSAHE